MSTSPSNIRVLLVGGGTGGHFYPLVSIAEALNKMPERPELYYAGPDPYDAGALKAEGVTYVRTFGGKTRRYKSILNFLDSFKTLFGFFVALVKLYLLYPDVVVSKGGYTSVPVVLAGVFLRIPIIVHESDSVVGRANKLGSRFAKHTVVSYAETEASLHGKSVLLFGIPIRRALLSPKTGKEGATLNVDPNRPVIFVIGGSQGAERVNELILDSLDELLTTFTVIHQTGETNFELVKQSAETLITNQDLKQYYLPTPFLDAVTLNDVYHLAHLIISRAGSTSIYEIALHGKPSILVPIPEDISHDQRSNAYAYARTGAASVLEEKNLNDSLLQAEIERIMQNTDLYNEMAQAATAFPVRESAEKIANLIVGVAKEH
jgi:UDP-N-acetylglucosamine--N-acetylmuramyl-(pentapeptide) pyrophosphoryl-undecaprenol N-acetylglucosamine transferase